MLLIVNVASRCSFTPQYVGLEELYRRHKDQGFAVLGFPCDQFLHQEPGDETEIQSFCSRNFGVTFPMFAKVKRQRPRRASAVPIHQRGASRLVRHDKHQMELRKVPDRSHGQGRQALLDVRQARAPGTGCGQAVKLASDPTPSAIAKVRLLCRPFICVLRIAIRSLAIACFAPTKLLRLS